MSSRGLQPLSEVFSSLFCSIRLIVLVLQSSLHQPHSLVYSALPSFTVAQLPTLSPYGPPSLADPSLPTLSKAYIPPLEGLSSFEPLSIRRFLRRRHFFKSSHLLDVLILTRPSVAQTPMAWFLATRRFHRSRRPRPGTHRTYHYSGDILPVTVTFSNTRCPYRRTDQRYCGPYTWLLCARLQSRSRLEQC